MLDGKLTFYVSEPPLGARDNIRCSSYAHWKARNRLPISVSWTFWLEITAEALRGNID